MAEQTYSIIDGGEGHPGEEETLAYEVLVGLSSTPKRLPSRYFYDDVGSDLFRQIMALDEYYPTRCEHEVLARHAAEIAQAVKGPLHLVDLGAGDGAKTKVVLRALIEANADIVYVPIDISVAAIEGLIKEMAKTFPELPVSGVVGEYASSIRWLASNRGERANLVLFLGSNIGNFPMAEAKGFLGQLWAQMRTQDRLLVGFDLKKDIEKLLAAYNDSKGVTAAFNLNLLTRINRQLDADFNVNAFRHYGTYDVMSGAMKSYLVSLERQSVRVGALDRSFDFDPWEPVHTEYSYKYLRSDIDSLCRDSGFEPVARYEDSKGWFVDDLWGPRKGRTLTRA